MKSQLSSFSFPTLWKGPIPCFVGLLLGILICFNSNLADAHMTLLGQSVVEIEVKTGKIRILVGVSAQDVGTYLRLDKNKNKRIEREEWLERRPDIASYFEKKLLISNSGKLCHPTNRRFVKRPDERRIYYLQMHQCPLPLTKLMLENTILFDDVGGHRHYTNIKIGKRKLTTIFSQLFPTYTIHLSNTELASATSRPASQPTSQPTSTAQVQAQSNSVIWVLRYIWEGIYHILIGLDHVLFILCLLFVTRSLRTLFLIVTAFTLGHTVTLILGALSIISLPTQPTEAAIALSIAYVALENIMRRHEEPQHRYILTFLFGLVHGVGFSYVLGDLVQLKGKALVPALLCFNVGVELGQLFIVGLAFPILYRSMRWRHYSKLLVIVNFAICALALYWFVERLFLSG